MISVILLCEKSHFDRKKKVTHWLRANRISLNVAKTNNSIPFMQNKNDQKANFR